VIVHGDFGPHNMLFDSTEGVTAILDWERARLGSPEDDMGWAELSIRIYQPPETAHSLKWFFEGYGIRPPWMVRREFMVRLCEMMREIDPIDRMGAASDLWAQRARTVSTWTQLPDD
jgi:thiamine kinase-like enzyme